MVMHLHKSQFCNLHKPSYCQKRQLKIIAKTELRTWHSIDLYHPHEKEIHKVYGSRCVCVLY